jgi:hypothetical protein
MGIDCGESMMEAKKMKKHFFFLISVFILSLFTYSNAYAAAGSCTQTRSDLCNSGSCIQLLSFNCVFGTGANATDALTLSTTSEITAALKTWHLLLGTTYNGATAPTALYDLYLKETVGSTADAVDILGTAGMNRPGTAGTSSQFTPITDTTYATSGLRPVLSTLTLTASGNAVESGSFTVQFIFVK